MDEGLEVEPELRRAVAAALGDVLTAMAATASLISDVGSPGGRQGVFVIEGPGGASPTRGVREREAAAVSSAAAAAGGGPLVAALRRDPTGHVARLLERSVWVPDLAAALALHGSLPPGWRVATPAGGLVTDEGVVYLDPGQETLEVRARHAEVERAIRDPRRGGRRQRGRSMAADVELEAARAAVTTTRSALEPMRTARRVAEEQAARSCTGVRQRCPGGSMGGITGRADGARGGGDRGGAAHAGGRDGAMAGTRRWMPPQTTSHARRSRHWRLASERFGLSGTDTPGSRDVGAPTS